MNVELTVTDGDSFTRVLDVLPGSLRVRTAEPETDELLPARRLSAAIEGVCAVRIDANFTVGDALALAERTGLAPFTLAGAVNAAGALFEVTLGTDTLFRAELVWHAAAE